MRHRRRSRTGRPPTTPSRPSSRRGSPHAARRSSTPAVTDYAGGTLGWRVRVGAFADQAGAVAERAPLVAAGWTGAAYFTGWDGETVDTGPWRVEVLTIDPRRFRGELDVALGPDIERRETTSALAAAAGATAGVNAGFFVLDPAAGAPGDPAGVSVVDGRLLSETVDGRPALVLRDDARRTDVVRLTWRGEVRTRSGRLAARRRQPRPGAHPQLRRHRRRPPHRLPAARLHLHGRRRARRLHPGVRGRHAAGAGVEVVLDAPRAGDRGAHPARRPGPGRWAARSRRPACSRPSCRPSPARVHRLDVRTRLLDDERRPAVDPSPHLRRQRRPGARPRRRAARHPRRPTAWCARTSRASTTGGRTSGTRGRSPARTSGAGSSSSPPTGAAPRRSD